eukprot:scaffold57208_cov31-Tisochrysis_lutea.AAC.3
MRRQPCSSWLHGRARFFRLRTSSMSSSICSLLSPCGGRPGYGRTSHAREEGADAPPGSALPRSVREALQLEADDE